MTEKEKVDKGIYPLEFGESLALPRKFEEYDLGDQAYILAVKFRRAKSSGSKRLWFDEIIEFVAKSDPHREAMSDAIREIWTVPSGRAEPFLMLTKSLYCEDREERITRLRSVLAKPALSLV